MGIDWENTRPPIVAEDDPRRDVVDVLAHAAKRLGIIDRLSIYHLVEMGKAVRRFQDERDAQSMKCEEAVRAAVKEHVDE